MHDMERTAPLFFNLAELAFYVKTKVNKSNNIQAIFGIVVNYVLIIEKCLLKCKCLMSDQQPRCSSKCSLGFKAHLVHVTQICLIYWLLPS